jgi:hypothetical protein
MSYVEQWNAIAARIRSLHNAADLYAQLVGSQPDVIRGGDGGTLTVLARHCRSIVYEIEGFQNAFSASLPLAAKACLDKFLNGQQKEIFGSEVSHVRYGPVLLTAFEAEMSFVLADAQEVIRARSDRAFLHLQRLLVVDADIRKKWKTAFNAGETACEKLGDVHLLWHGIFAFKINAQGARTDLIFSEPIDASVVQKGVEGLVLTEWKVADKGNAASRFEDARKQAAKYEQGALVGTELTGYRYAVAVSLTELPNVPDDVTVGGVVYRHINIVVEPRTPSVQARKRART